MQKAVVALAFGVPADLHSNKCIARSASQQAMKLGYVPIFTQLGMQMEDGLPAVHVSGEYRGHWANTMQMAAAAIDWAQQESISELWIAAATPHMSRCLRDFRWIVMQKGLTIAIHECPQTQHFTDSDWFRAESEQFRTQSKLKWWLWNGVLQCLPMSLYSKLTDKPL